MDDQPTPTLLRLPAVLARTALSRSRLYELIRAGRFPAPVKLAESSINVWSADAVSAWIAGQINANKDSKP
ncbi:prophage regulatory protein [Aquamicrobium terrae]